MAQPAAVKYDVLWSPSTPDKYVTFGPDLNLYQVESCRLEDAAPEKGDRHSLSEDAFSYLLSQNGESLYPKCIAWYPKPDHDHLVAVGQANGKILLTSLHSKSNDDLIGREFSPKHARQCYCLAWNPEDSNLLAAGLDKTRNDPCILVWDVMHKQDAPPSSPEKWHGPSSTGGTSGPGHVDFISTKALFELGPSEAAHSISWFRMQKKTFVTGINKYLRVYDLKDPSAKPLSATTKCVHGVSIDPQNESRLASFVESQLCIWDLRNFEKPVFTFQEPRNISKISWCPTRSGLLASLIRDTNYVKIYDVGHMPSGSEDLEPNGSERKVPCPASWQMLSSFDWHPTVDQRMLTISTTGDVKVVKIYEKLASGMDTHKGIIWLDGKNVGAATLNISEDDVLPTMRARAEKGYGLQESRLCENADLSYGDSQVAALWDWIDLMKNLQMERVLRRPDDRLTSFVGIDGIIHGQLADSSLAAAVAGEQMWRGVDSKNVRTWYRSIERDRCLLICRWPKSPEDVRLVLSRLQDLGKYEKAAAIALFHLEVKEALAILNTGALKRSGHSRHARSTADEKEVTGPNLSVVALALSGFAESRNTLWREMCRNMKEQITDPYIKSMFAFLTDENDYSAILYEEDLCLNDRLAFACLYLNDAKLVEYVTGLKQDAMENGILEGLIITGLESDGIDLLQAYVDCTCDVQTASLAMIHSQPNATAAEDCRVDYWIQCYRHLLDRWKCWELRADFDIFRREYDRSKQIFLICTYCGKPAMPGDLHQQQQQRRSYTLSGSQPMKHKVSVCVECRKPLPRCALCLTNMGTASGLSAVGGNLAIENTMAMRLTYELPYTDEWFSWCQICRHGGHAGHIRDWFRQNKGCPVSGCPCKCNSLDCPPMGDLDRLTLHAKDH